MYCVGPYDFDFVVKPSIPEGLVTSGDAFFFQTKMKFKKEDFTKFDKTEIRISKDLLAFVAKEICSKHFRLNLIGMDLLVQEDTGLVYIIDINYFSSYEDLPNLDVEKSLKHLILSEYKTWLHNH